MKQIKFTLKNKLKVILVPSHKSPVVSVQMWVKNGSADEQKGEEGVSHFIEHLVFKGTRKYGPGEIAQIVEASGGELNAYTSFDQTVFYVTISKSFSETALSVICEMMGFPKFDPTETDNEREVVCEEIKMGLDSPQRAGSQMLFNSVYKKHPYGIPVIGYEKNVRGWSHKKIKQYYSDRYSTANMCLVITGDFDSAQMKQQVVKMYSEIPLTKLKAKPRKKESAIKQPRFLTIQKKFPEKQLYFSWPSVNVKHKDVAALDVLAQVLGQGDMSRLVQKLRIEKPAVNSVGVFNYTPQDSGLLSISIKYTDQDLDVVFKDVWTAIEDVKMNGINEQDISRAIVAVAAEQFYNVETVDGIAQKLGSSQFYFGDSNAYLKYLKQIQSLKTSDVLKVAKKYLVPEKTCLALMSDVDKKKSEQILKAGLQEWKKVAENFRSEQKQKLKLKKSKPAAKSKRPKIGLVGTVNASKQTPEVVKTKRGNDIIFLSNKELPTLSARLIMGGGARLESVETMGAFELLTRTWMTKTATKSELQISAATEDTASSISPFSGKNTVGMSTHCLKAFEEPIANLTFELLSGYTPDEAAFMREKEIMKRQITSQEDKPSFLCVRQFHQKLYPNHPLSFEQLGTKESIDGLKVQQLQGILAQSYRDGNAQLVVVGDYDKELWLHNMEQLEAQFDHKNKGKLLNQTPVKPIAKRETLFLEKDKEQSHVIVGWQALNLTDPDRYVLQILQAIMAGQGGRLFLELRDKNSLAYSVSPIRMESLETGYFGGYIACSPEKVKKAIEMFDAEFEKICTHLVSDQELSRAQKYLIGQHDIGLQRKSSICNLLSFDHFYDNDFNESLNIAKKYFEVTPADVKRVARRLFEKPSIVSVVGKRVA